MSYTINNKLYTDNPLLDEIVYNAKIMIDGIILKDCDDADKNETELSIKMSDIYMSIKRDNKQFYLFNYEYDGIKRILTEKYPEDNVPDTTILLYATNNNLIPEKYRLDLIDYYADKFLNEYVEYNNYYRMLNGTEDYGFVGYDNYKSDGKIWDGYKLNSNILPNDLKSYFNIGIPLSQYDNQQIGMLEEYGILKRLIDDYPNLLYLNHLGSKKIDIYTARIAEQFEVIYLPEAEPLVRSRFREILDKNRIIYSKRHYSLAYKFESDYYNKIMILLIIAQSVTDLIVETPEWYIRRDIFDIRTVEYILTTNGVKFFSKIPLRYQLSLVHILNRVIKYKSCNKNIFDLASIFNLDELSVYKYYIMKSRKMDIYGNYVTLEKETIDSDGEVHVSEDIENMYNLIFVKTPIDDSYGDYINKNSNRIDYDDITQNKDYYWDSVNDHNVVKQQILEKDFTIQSTKFLSVEKEFDSKEYQFQLQYMINLILNNSLDLSDLKLKIPVINSSSEFELRDAFVLLYIISFSYYENKTKDIIISNNRVPKPMPIEPEEYIIDGGHAYRNDPVFEDYCGGGVYGDLVEEYEDDKDIVDKSFPYDFSGGVSFGFYGAEDWVGEQDGDGKNGGNPRNSYINIFSGSDYWHKPSIPFDEKSFDKEFPHVDLSNRLYGFNLFADLDYLKSIISIKCPHYDINGNFTRDVFTLEELGVEDFKTIYDNKIKEVNELIDIYNHNKKIHDELLSRTKNVQSKVEYDVYKFTYDYLFTFEVDYSYFKLPNGTIAETYSEFLKNKNLLLYDYYRNIMKESNLEQRQYNISACVNNIIESIKAYLNCADVLNYLFYFVESESWSVTLGYFTLLLEFFKSFKTQFLEITGSLMFIGNNGGSSDTKFHIYDNKKYIDNQFDKVDNITIFDIKSETNIDFEWKDSIKIDDKIFIIPDYDSKVYMINGGNPIERPYYFNIPDNKDSISSEPLHFMLDGNSIIEKRDDSYTEYDEWNGGTPAYTEIEDVINNGRALEQPFYADYCNN